MVPIKEGCRVSHRGSCEGSPIHTATLPSWEVEQQVKPTQCMLGWCLQELAEEVWPALLLLLSGLWMRSKVNCTWRQFLQALAECTLHLLPLPRSPHGLDDAMG